MKFLRAAEFMRFSTWPDYCYSIQIHGYPSIVSIAFIVTLKPKVRSGNRREAALCRERPGYTLNCVAMNECQDAGELSMNADVYDCDLVPRSHVQTFLVMIWHIWGRDHPEAYCLLICGISHLPIDLIKHRAASPADRNIKLGIFPLSILLTKKGPRHCIIPICYIQGKCIHTAFNIVCRPERNVGFGKGAANFRYCGSSLSKYHLIRAVITRAIGGSFRCRKWF
jgi:hypothetical protein